MVPSRLQRAYIFSLRLEITLETLKWESGALRLLVHPLLQLVSDLEILVASLGVALIPNLQLQASRLPFRLETLDYTDALRDTM